MPCSVPSTRPERPFSQNLEDAMTDAAIDILERLEQSGAQSPNQQGQIIRKIADLFMVHQAAVSTSQLKLFDQVMMSLIDKVDEAVRVQLANRLGPAKAAPNEILKRLANDDQINVARPVLSQSKCLDDDFLVQSASTKSQDHLLAISTRDAINPRVTDILIDRGNDEVVITVAQNQGAEFSERGHHAVIARATQNGKLARALCRRPDVPRQMLVKLIEKASDEVRALFEAEGDIRTRELQAIVASASQELKEQSQYDSEGYSRAKARILALKQTGGVSELHVARFARDESFEEVVAALSDLARLRLVDVERYVLQAPSDQIIILCRALGFSWPTVRQIALMVQGGPIANDQLERLQTKFENLPRDAAAKALQFNQMRQLARSQ